MRVVHSLGKKEFTLGEIYSYEKELSRLHPKNFHIKDKIRQQLQILRDKGLLRFEELGRYSLV